MKTIGLSGDIAIRGPVISMQERILTQEALEFLVELHREFNPRRLELLAKRTERQHFMNLGSMPGYLKETAAIREGNWKIDSVPDDLQNRRVEITGPVDRKMVINALNSGANCFMADFEDSHSPTWEGTLDGQINLFNAVRGTISYTNPEGREYSLNKKVATLLVRPRGWHLNEKHLLIGGCPASGSLFDFAIYFFHNARERLKRGSGIYLYLPKLEHYLEARLWNDVFVKAEEMLGIPQGSIKATVLIEHILAAFQMSEILYELRHHSSGLNCGRWDYLFSYIKTFGKKEEFIVPDRAQVTMTVPFMRAYTLGCIKECHKRNAHAMGGMAAYIPVKSDAAANEQALAKVRDDKRREATDGHDGTWVAHPGLVSIAREEFDRVLGDTPNQISRQRAEPPPDSSHLIEPPRGTITEEGLRTNIRVAIQYIEAWLGGLGCVPLYNLMEDAATAEISRTQVWQWVHNPRGILDDGRRVTLELTRDLIRSELDRIRRERGEQRFQGGHFAQATHLFEDLIDTGSVPEFLTLKAYELID